MLLFRRISWLVPASAALVACVGSTSNPEDGPSVDGTEQQVTSLLELKCKAGNATFDISPAFGGVALEGKLSVGSASTLFICKTPAAFAGAPANLVATCTERPQTVHPGQWEVAVTKTSPTATPQATLKRGEAGPDVAFACEDPSAPPPDGGVSIVVPTFAEIKPILDAKCSGCHQSTFGTLEKVKARRQAMFGMISSGAMPRFQPTWKDTDDGKKTLSFLKNSPELQ
jgi:hypothetical protein